jgi:hypothetical protein
VSSSDPLDLDHGLPVTAEDVVAQRRLQAPPFTSAGEYLDFLDALPAPTYEELKARRGPRGEPFVLP